MKSIVVMGTPKFCVPILEGLSQEYDIKAVVTQPDRPVGRKRVLKPSPVKEKAEELELPILQPSKIGGSKEMQDIIDLSPDFIVTAAYGQFLPTKLLNAAKIAAINVHGSLLPKYRGGAPVQYAIMNNEKKTGISIMYMVKQMDAGDIIAQQSTPIEANDDTASMFDKLSFIGRDLTLKTIPKLIDGNFKATPQDENKVVFAPTIKRNQEELDFNHSASLIDAKIRAFRPNPGAYVMMKGKRTKIWDTTPLDETTNLNPGVVVEKTKHDLKIAAGNKSVIQINDLQPAGKHRQQITDYLNGTGQNIKEKEQVINNE